MSLCCTFIILVTLTVIYCNIIDFVTGIWVPFYGLIISTGLPFIIMLFTTCRVRIYLVKNKKNIKSKKEMKLFKILLGMNIFFFFFFLQWLIFQLEILHIITCFFTRTIWSGSSPKQMISSLK
jgi:hypothetical protein